MKNVKNLLSKVEFYHFKLLWILFSAQLHEWLKVSKCNAIQTSPTTSFQSSCELLNWKTATFIICLIINYVQIEESFPAFEGKIKILLKVWLLHQWNVRKFGPEQYNLHFATVSPNVCHCWPQYLPLLVPHLEPWGPLRS